ncbi:MAG: FCD domain-containing protein [Rhizobiaceae bacterium]
MSELFSKIEQTRTADEVVGQIESLILEGILHVGDRLPGERDLARRFDVSRPILREALKQLESRGLLVSRHGGGTFVADVIGPVFTEPVMELISTHRKATVDYLEFRREMDGMAAEYAARRATDADRRILDDIIARMERAHGKADFAEEAAIDVEFHNAVGESAHNIILLHTLRACYRLLADGVMFNRALIYAQPEARARLLAQHQAIHAAIRDGKPAEARRAAEAHLRFIEQALTDAERTGDWKRISELRLKFSGGF